MVLGPDAVKSPWKQSKEHKTWDAHGIVYQELLFSTQKKMDAEGISETLSDFFQTTRHYNSEDNLHHSNEHLGLQEPGNFLIMWLHGVRNSYKLIC
jgi:hypothetical protein